MHDAIAKARADPGFPVGGGADPLGGTCQHTILSNFPKNCMKSRKFWAVRGGARRVRPPKSATEKQLLMYTLSFDWSVNSFIMIVYEEFLQTANEVGGR